MPSNVTYIFMGSCCCEVHNFCEMSNLFLNAIQVITCQYYTDSSYAYRTVKATESDLIQCNFKCRLIEKMDNTIHVNFIFAKLAAICVTVTEMGL